LEILEKQEAFILDTRITVEESREEGLQEGLEQGRQEGRQEGLEQGQQHALRRVLQSRFGALPPEVEARLAALSVDEVAWAIDVALSAASLEQVMVQVGGRER
jgi:flagellar biosynthesis/type III secretory pathway protein FliH